MNADGALLVLGDERVVVHQTLDKMTRDTGRIVVNLVFCELLRGAHRFAVSDDERRAGRHSALGNSYYLNTVNVADLPGDEHVLRKLGSLGVAVALLYRIEKSVGNVRHSADRRHLVVADGAVYREKITVCGGVAGGADRDVLSLVCGGFEAVGVHLRNNYLVELSAERLCRVADTRRGIHRVGGVDGERERTLLSEGQLLGGVLQLLGVAVAVGACRLVVVHFSGSHAVDLDGLRTGEFVLPARHRSGERSEPEYFVDLI